MACRTHPEPVIPVTPGRFCGDRLLKLWKSYGEGPHVSEPNSHICPECSAPRGLDGTPSCGCARRVSDALLEARTAEAAAAEDFDPLRIRPYVELGDEKRQGLTTPRQDTPTMALPAVTSFEAGGKAAWSPDAPRPHGAPGVSQPHGTPGTPPSSSPSPSSPPRSPGRPSSPSWASRPRRRRRRTGIVVALAGTAAAGMVAVAGAMSGLFSYDTPERDSALPEDVRASAPDASADGGASPVEPAPGKPDTGAGAPASTPSGNARRPSPSKSPSPSPSQTSPSPSAPASASPPQPSPSAEASEGTSAAGANEAGAADDQKATPKVLRLGDDDPEVLELQLRLNQLGFYYGDFDQNFDAQVEEAVIAFQKKRDIPEEKEKRGVYGFVTRTQLESETKEP
ncbi:peptidoglycan-binding protein [Streptomyces ipomoeae]|nr:peptidoglycan-binding protein [Streptomyces ipomoeae]